MSKMNNDIYIKNKEFPWQTIDEETIVIDPATKNSFELNAMGSFIWTQFDGKSTVESIRQQVCEEYAVPAAEAEDDLFQLVEFLKINNLVEKI